MKKTVSINLGGLIFNIDEDAYARLQNYLDTIKGYFSESDGRDEIMADIELRIAEMLQERLGKIRQVVTMDDIDHVIKVMGRPEDYVTEDEEPISYDTADKSSYQPGKKLFRDPEDRIFGGVCSGIGHYFGIDAVWIRLIFASAFIFLGTGLLLYIILWIIIPIAKTPSDKLRMRGEPINFENIGKKVEEEINRVKKNFSPDSRPPVTNKLIRFVRQVVDFVIELIRGVLKFVVKFIGVIIIIVGLSLLFSLLLILLADSTFTMNGGLITFTYDDVKNLLFLSETQAVVATIGLALAIGIPLLVLTYTGFVLTVGINRLNKHFALSMIAFFIIGVILTVFASIETASQFTRQSKITQKIIIDSLVSDTFNIEVYDDNSLWDMPVALTEDTVYLRNVHVNIYRNESQNIKIRIDMKSRGKTMEEATFRAERIQYEFTQLPDGILLQDHLKFDPADKWRDQQVDISVYLPEGTVLYVDDEVENLLNYTDLYDRRKRYGISENFWKMTDSGLIETGQPIFDKSAESGQGYHPGLADTADSFLESIRADTLVF